MSFEIDKQEVVKSKKESRMQLICSIIAMVLMVIIIILLITASIIASNDETITFADQKWAWVSASVFGALLLIDIVVFIILKVQFKKQRNKKETKVEETIIVEDQNE